MATIQWRPEINALTTPQSWRPRFIARNTPGKAEIAARMARALPNYSEEEFRTFIDLRNQIIMESLSNGEQVTEENAFTYSLAFSGRLNSPDDPLPPLEECLHVRVHASPVLTAAVRHPAQAERLPEEKKLPFISTAQDTLLGLKDVLNPQGLLQLAGADLNFNRSQGDEGCVLEGTKSGRTVQTRFGKIEDSEIIVMPEVLLQDNPWNNEYRVSVSTRYSAHGTLRTGTCSRLLRTPLPVTGFSSETGILSGAEDSPHVSIIGGTVTANGPLRIQAVFDSRQDALLFSLIDMQEGGAAVTAAANGTFTLQGFSGSGVTSLSIRVDNYAGLKTMCRSNYGGRLADILQMDVV